MPSGGGSRRGRCGSPMCPSQVPTSMAIREWWTWTGGGHGRRWTWCSPVCKARITMGQVPASVHVPTTGDERGSPR